MGRSHSRVRDDPCGVLRISRRLGALVANSRTGLSQPVAAIVQRLVSDREARDIRTAFPMDENRVGAVFRGENLFEGRFDAASRCRIDDRVALRLVHRIGQIALSIQQLLGCHARIGWRRVGECFREGLAAQQAVIRIKIAIMLLGLVEKPPVHQAIDAGQELTIATFGFQFATGSIHERAFGIVRYLSLERIRIADERALCCHISHRPLSPCRSVSRSAAGWLD